MTKLCRETHHFARFARLCAFECMKASMPAIANSCSFSFKQEVIVSAVLRTIPHCSGNPERCDNAALIDDI